MTLTADLITTMGYSTDDLSASDSLMFTAALEWLNMWTDFDDINTTDDDAAAEAVKELPAGAKLFILKYIGMLNGGGLSGSSIQSESIGGMSKSYGSSTDTETSLRLLAWQLLGTHYTGGRVGFAADYSRWM